ncbi:topoisomerase C-terminal repeat-containing protein [Sphingobacterium olei]
MKNSIMQLHFKKKWKLTLHPLGIADIESPVNKGKTSLIKGMKSKAGKKFDAYIVLNEDYKTSFEFAKNKSYNK